MLTIALYIFFYEKDSTFTYHAVIHFRTGRITSLLIPSFFLSTRDGRIGEAASKQIYLWTRQKNISAPSRPTLIFVVPVASHQRRQRAHLLWKVLLQKVYILTTRNENGQRSTVTGTDINYTTVRAYLTY